MPDSLIIKWIITGKEKWVYEYDVETVQLLNVAIKMGQNRYNNSEGHQSRGL